MWRSERLFWLCRTAPEGAGEEDCPLLGLQTESHVREMKFISLNPSKGSSLLPRNFPSTFLYWPYAVCIVNTEKTQLFLNTTKSRGSPPPELPLLFTTCTHVGKRLISSAAMGWLETTWQNAGESTVCCCPARHSLALRLSFPLSWVDDLIDFWDVPFLEWTSAKGEISTVLSNLNLYTLFPRTYFESCICLQTYDVFSWNYQDLILGDLD